VLAAAQKDDGPGVSAALHSTGYYEGFGATVADRIRNHYTALSRGLKAADKAMAEPVDPARSAQRALAALGYYQGAIDGAFGPRSQAAATAYCLAHPDRIV
jgi:hypothetical protein